MDNISERLMDKMYSALFSDVKPDDIPRLLADKDYISRKVESLKTGDLQELLGLFDIAIAQIEAERAKLAKQKKSYSLTGGLAAAASSALIGYNIRPFEAAREIAEKLLAMKYESAGGLPLHIQNSAEFSYAVDGLGRILTTSAMGALGLVVACGAVKAFYLLKEQTLEHESGYADLVYLNECLRAKHEAI